MRPTCNLLTASLALELSGINNPMSWWTRFEMTASHAPELSGKFYESYQAGTASHALEFFGVQNPVCWWTRLEMTATCDLELSRIMNVICGQDLQ